MLSDHHCCCVICVGWPLLSTVPLSLPCGFASLIPARYGALHYVTALHLTALNRRVHAVQAVMRLGVYQLVMLPPMLQMCCRRQPGLATVACYSAFGVCDPGQCLRSRPATRVVSVIAAGPLLTWRL